MASASGWAGGRPASGLQRSRLAAIAALVLAIALVAASCDSGSPESSTSESTGGSQGETATQADFVPEGAERAVATYLQGEGVDYIGDCADAELPRDRGSWCSTLVEDGDEQKVYELGPVGEEPELVLTLDRRGQATLTPGHQVDVGEGDVGVPRQLTPEQLLADSWITSNVLLDLAAGIGNGLADLGAPTTTDGDTGPPPDDGTPGGDTGGGGADPVVTPTPGANQYPPGGEIVVDDPNITPGGIVVFRGSGCLPDEVLSVSFDGKPIGTLTADAQGAFTGSLEVPVGTAPGAHTLTVKGGGCELNAIINVQGGLAFTGASNDTSTTVLVGVAALVLGLVLVIGSRRRRSSGSPQPTSGAT